ncbi:MAG: PIG-L family deacetylase [Anaerolineae bacterium]|nr:PIG-L family deacetylase [Anaerolineae bacterium]
MTAIYQHVYLSPHFDDAALSCGGAIHQQTRSGQKVLVVTICAAPPPSNVSLSLFARALHASWGNPDDIVATRRAEDRASMAILGADYLWLDFVDCIYRGNPEKGEWFYLNNDDLFGQVHPADLALVDKIVQAVVERIPKKKTTVVYAPLSIGHHVDHQLTHAAAWQLQQRGWPVVFFEDYPYVDSERFVGWNLEVVLAHLRQMNRHLKPRLQTFSEKDLQAKVDSIRAYASQLVALFNSEMEMAERVRGYAGQVGEGRAAERIWLPSSTPRKL